MPSRKASDPADSSKIMKPSAAYARSSQEAIPLPASTLTSNYNRGDTTIVLIFAISSKACSTMSRSWGRRLRRRDRRDIVDVNYIPGPHPQDRLIYRILRPLLVVYRRLFIGFLFSFGWIAVPPDPSSYFRQYTFFLLLDVPFWKIEANSVHSCFCCPLIQAQLLHSLASKNIGKLAVLKRATNWLIMQSKSWWFPGGSEETRTI